jgi:hypothetical protein
MDIKDRPAIDTAGMTITADAPSVVETRPWVERVVLGLSLCPFAPAPALKGRIRYAMSGATTPATFLEDLAVADELLVALGLEASITRAVEAFGDTSGIPAANIATLEALGHEGLEAVRRGGAR